MIPYAARALRHLADSYRLEAEAFRAQSKAALARLNAISPDAGPRSPLVIQSLAYYRETSAARHHDAWAAERLAEACDAGAAALTPEPPDPYLAVINVRKAQLEKGEPYQLIMDRAGRTLAHVWPDPDGMFDGAEVVRVALSRYLAKFPQAAQP